MAELIRRPAGGPPRKAAAKKAPTRKMAAKKAPAKKAAPAPAKKAPAKKVAAKKVVPAPPPVVEPTEEDEVLEGEIIDPTYEAYKLKLSGMGWREIADKTGFGDWQDCRNSVAWFLNRAAAEQATDRRAQALELSIARHEALVSAWWSRAVDICDPAAAAIVSRELAAIDKVQRLGEKDVENVGGARPLVIAGTPEEYQAGLVRAALGEGRVVAMLPPARNEVIDQ